MYKLSFFFQICRVIGRRHGRAASISHLVKGELPIQFNNLFLSHFFPPWSLPSVFISTFKRQPLSSTSLVALRDQQRFHVA